MYHTQPLRPNRSNLHNWNYQPRLKESKFFRNGEPLFQVEQNQMEQNEVEQNQMERNQVEQNQIERNQCEQNQLDSDDAVHAFSHFRTASWMLDQGRRVREAHFHVPETHLLSPIHDDVESSDDGSMQDSILDVRVDVVKRPTKIGLGSERIRTADGEPRDLSNVLDFEGIHKPFFIGILRYLHAITYPNLPGREKLGFEGDPKATKDLESTTNKIFDYCTHKVDMTIGKPVNMAWPEQPWDEGLVHVNMRNTNWSARQFTELVGKSIGFVSRVQFLRLNLTMDIHALRSHGTPPIITYELYKYTDLKQVTITIYVKDIEEFKNDEGWPRLCQLLDTHGRERAYRIEVELVVGTGKFFFDRWKEETAIRRVREMDLGTGVASISRKNAIFCSTFLQLGGQGIRFGS